MNFNQPYIQGNDSNLEILSSSGKIIGYRDDRNNGGRRDISMCQIGDLWKGWYLIKDTTGTGLTNTPSDENIISLVYDIKLEELEIKDISHTCFTDLYTTKDRYKFLSQGLQDSLKNEGQKTYIDAIKHYSKNVSNSIKFIDGTTLDHLRIYEGHHRVLNLEELGETKVKARTYYLYDMEEPIDIDWHYNNNYDDSLWSEWQPRGDARNPWFTLGHFQDLSTTHKYNILMKCFEFIKQLKIEVTNIIDVGSGEGCYTYLASKEFDSLADGIDTEAGQILRGHLAKLKFDISDCNFYVRDWNIFDYSKYDFGLGLSITHHMSDPEDWINKFLTNKNAAILEIRSKTGNDQMCGSIKGFKTFQETLEMLDRTGYKNQHMGSIDGNRQFFVLWK